MRKRACQLAVELARLINDPQAPENERSCVVPTILKLTADPVKEVRRTLADALVGVRDLAWRYPVQHHRR